MGTDIHAIWQARKDGQWVDVPSTWDQDRHYFLFSWLADVRNGYGFAGVATYEPIIPIASPRGLPGDFMMIDEHHPTTPEATCARRAGWGHDDSYWMGDHSFSWRWGHDDSYWMGDHSFSWLTADEILSAPVPGFTTRHGVIKLEQFAAWDGKGRPADFCGGIMGKGLKTSSPADIDASTTHVSVSWTENAGDDLAYFVDEVRRLKELHGDVRLVFGFDS